MTPPRTMPVESHGWTRFFRNPATGKVVIAQPPNVPLAIFLAATVAPMVLKPTGGLRAGLSIAAGIGLVWWAIDEIVRGESPFRRVLGGAVLVGVAATTILTSW